MAPLNIIMAIIMIILTASEVTSQAVIKLNHVYANIDTSKRSGMFEIFKSHDIVRHMRILKSIGDLPVGGSSDIQAIGLYYTQIMLGTPPKLYSVHIDTGSEVLWVKCKPCKACPKQNGIEIPLNIFDPRGSSTFSPLPCKDRQCVPDYHCTSPEDYCGYSIEYADGSGISGYLVSDQFQFKEISRDLSTYNVSAKIIFGCGFHPSGLLTNPQFAVDGIFGFGKNELSIISQLFSKKLVPHVFSHCLQGPDLGGGVLVLGEIIEPGMVYTRLIPSSEHYLVNLLGIDVNGEKLPINPQMFATTDHSGTVVDSGSTLAYLTDEAYDPFVNTIVAAVLHSTQFVLFEGNQCFLTNNSVDQIFPPVTLHFEDATMKLVPQDYLFQISVNGTTEAWCMGWQKSPNNLRKWTILGDLVLKNKVIVYNLEKQTLGWTNFNCHSGVNVSFFDDNNYGMSNGSGNTPSNERPSSSECTTSKIVKELLIYFFFVHVILYITIIHANT